MHFYQLQAVAYHLNSIKYGDDYNLYREHDEDAIVMKEIDEGIIPHKFTHRILKQRVDCTTWEQSEWKQHMFGDPIPRPSPKKDKDGKLKHPTVLPFVWTYLLKDGNTPKARGTCNGGKQYSRAITMAHTYTNWMEQPASRMFWPLAALHGMTVI